MSITFANALGIHETALHFRGSRASVLANNLANVDTPNFKAKDLDFNQALQQQMKSSGQFEAARTNEAHIGASSFSLEQGELLYRTPQQPSIDGNTVEDQIEHAEYMKNTLAFQASFQFLNSKFQGLRSAIRGE
jgi:flagellar basal-body rod protein FlgB